MTRPLVKPIRPEFSSGPCAKRPDWSLQALTKATVARSHRHKAAKQKLEKIIELTKSILEIPDNYFVGIVPGSDTGAIEMAMWNLLGPRPINMLVWDSFGLDWANDIQSQLKLKDVVISKVDYGLLPDFSKENLQGDIVFNWNGTTAGVCIPNADWINPNRDGITICDATSAAFAMKLDWSKLDVTTFSWQKCLGGEAGHGMLIVSPKAVKRINEYNPDWPIPKLFQLKKNNMFNQEIFSGSTINTPSMICVEDFLDTLNWAKNIGGLSELTFRSENNLNIIKDWVISSNWIDFLSENSNTISSTSICLKLIDPLIINESLELKNNIEKNIIKLLEEEKVAFDIGSYRSAPPGLRIWGGPTVESKDIQLLLPWLDWAYAETLKKLNIN
ncbi:phosphoserine transaminase [Alphaproteobacteria bacterium]|jgi:phosphoserine aminotransferase|nr:phosphoserine transaminase [Alphaproteobacteria bacterium]|tara:strand:+ start:4332 stop:5495 length:1164 start_codon:yes stop_codon:yes gene_type:complete